MSALFDQLFLLFVVYYFDIFIHISFPLKLSRIHLGAVLLSGFTLAFIVLFAQFALAEDAVCGDGEVTDTEQCDDGNLSFGDGCSPVCEIEMCGNGVLETGEQCDDGNTRRSDGCDALCQIEYCGDGIQQILLSEQCDDGNALDDDGCSARCTKEISDPEEQSSSSLSSVVSSSLASSVSSSLSESLHSAASSRASSPSIPLSQRTALASQTFFTSPQGEDILSLLSSDDQAFLLNLLRSLGQGKKINQEQKDAIPALREHLSSALDRDREKYSSLLASLIDGVLSEEVTLSQFLDPALLRSGSLADILRSLEEKYRPFSSVDREELLASLTSLSLDEQTLRALRSDDHGTALSLLSQIVALKQRLAPLASTDVSASKQLLKEQIAFLRDNATLLERESGLSSEEFSALLSRASSLLASDQLSASALQPIETTLMRALPVPTSHTSSSRPALLSSSSASLAPATVEAFRLGTSTEQATVLHTLLLQDDVLQSLLVRAKEHHLTDLLTEYEALQGDIDALSHSQNTNRPCDDNTSALITCIHSYTLRLQDAVRQTSFFTRLVGRVQDYISPQ